MANVSVLMAAYREKPEYLRLAIESILSQTYSDFDFIIVLDDPDNLNLLEIMQYYAGIDKRVRIIVNEKNIGLALSLNKAIESSTGKYLARMDADDICLPDRFSSQVMYLDSHPEIAVLGTNKIIIDENGKTISKGSALPTTSVGIKETLKYSNIIVHPSVMMRAEIIKKVGGYRAFPTTQDYDLWSRLFDKGYKFAILNEYLIKYRINTSGVSMSRAYKQYVIGKYMEQLEQERKIKGEDSFSVEGLNIFLAENEVDNPEICRRFADGRALLEEGRIKIKNGQIFTGAMKLIQASKSHPYMRTAVTNQIKSIFVKRKYKDRG